MIIGISGKINSGKDTVAKMIQLLDAGYVDKEPLIAITENDIIDGQSQWQIKRFADKIKDTVCLWIGCNRAQLEDRKFKEAPLGKEWHVWKVIYAPTSSERLFNTEQERNTYFENRSFQRQEDCILEDYRLTPRKLMQLLGTEAGREIIHPNIWVNALFADYKQGHRGYDEAQLPVYKYPKWIIPDTRFPNEAKAIKDRNGILIRLNRFPKWTGKSEHPWVAEPTKVDKVYQTSPDEDLSDIPSFDSEEDAWNYVKSQSHPSETALDNWEGWDYVIDNNGDLNDLLIKVKGTYDKT